ncbi:KH homology domain-containing protein 4-like isoform X2 [Onychostoma macrolepis]|uniref:KH homology domain-containing protein 4-like isoform X2 n=1 Tax=Onychostoma macrolepis TaxID=369639 RepID=UPI00272A872D|nr:KH homology domain-containing protein 4-like isoform X2 [Onychostoma macrolepis]
MASGSPCVNSRWDRREADVIPSESCVSRGSSSADASGAPQGGVEMAAAMAAKINAMLMAKGKLKPLQPLPSKAPPAAPPVAAEELVVAEVDINDVPMECRNLLTKGKTHDEIGQLSGALVSTKGLYMSDADGSSCAGVRPLYLHVQGRRQDDVNKAVARIKQIISEDVLRSSGGQQPAVMPTVPVYRQTVSTVPGHKPAPPHTGSFVHTKIFVGLEQSQPSFNVRECVEGPSGSYLQHIQSETGARVFLRGRGSGYIEQASRRESFEPLYLYISHPNAAGLDAAKKLCENLLDTVRADHARIMSSYPSTASAPVYPTHSYSANNSYGGQSWYGYPNSYPTYPSAFWDNSSAASGQSQRSSGAVQYPVCKQSGFLLQDEDAASGGADSGSSPKQHSAEEEQKTQISTDVSVKDVSAADDSRTLMPPPAAPIRKRPREETCSKTLTHTAEEQLMMKKMKIPEDCSSSSGLVPYGGDSSDEEEERMRSGSKSSI